MSSIPFAAFSAQSVHEMIRTQKQQEDGKYGGSSTGQGLDDSTKKPKLGEMYNYNLKFMKSVWNMYNQYAPQAFQKNEELAKL